MAIGYNEYQGMSQPPQLNQNQLQAKYEILNAQQIQREISRVQNEITQVKSGTNKFKGEILRNLTVELNLAQEMLKEVQGGR